MTTDARGHTVPAGSDVFDPQASDVALSLSINDVIIAANATDAATKVAAIGPTAARPCLVWQTDTKTLTAYDGATAVQVNPAAWQMMAQSTVYSGSVTTTAAALAYMSFSLTVPTGRTLDVQFSAPAVNPAVGSGVRVWMTINGATVAGARVSTSTGVGLIAPVFLSGSIAGAGTSVAVAIMAQADSGTATVAADTITPAPITLRCRIV